MPGTARTTAANGQTCDGYRAFNLTMHVLLENAYGVDRDYIVGAPKWTDDEKFDVTLIFWNDTIDSINKLKPAMRIRAERAAIALFLTDRLNLVAHRAKNSMPAYSMVVGKKGRIPGIPLRECRQSRTERGHGQSWRIRVVR